MCDVLFLFVKLESFQNFSEDDEFQLYFTIGRRAMYFFASQIWYEFGISLTMMNFNNISSRMKARCGFAFYRNDIVL